MFPRWSPSGDQLAFASDRDVRPRICCLRRGETDAKVFARTAVELFPCFDWSPDGTRIVYIHGERTRLEILELATGEVAPLDVSLPGAYREIGRVCWARDGALYLIAMPIRNWLQAEVFRVDPESGTVRQLSDESDTQWCCREIAAARDGRVVVLRQEGDHGFRHGAYLLREDPSGAVSFESLTNASAPLAEYVHLSWYPDGNRLALSGLPAGQEHEQLFTLDLTSGAWQLLSHSLHHHIAPHVSVRFPDGPASPPTTSE